MAVTADNPEPNARPGDQGWTRPRAAAWVAVPLGSLNAAFSLLSLLLAGLAGWSLSRYLGNYTLAASILAASYSVVGALIASLRPRNPLGWIFLAVGFSQGFEQFAGTYAEYALVTNPGSSLPDGALMSWLSAFTWVPGLSLAITFVPLLFPDGGLPSRRWRPVAWLSTVPLAIFVVLQAYLWPYRGQIPRPKLGGLIGDLSDLLFPLMLVRVCLRELADVPLPPRRWEGAPADQVVRLRRHFPDRERSIRVSPLWADHLLVVVAGCFVDTSRRGHSHLEVSPLRHRRDHQSYPRIRFSDGNSCADLLRGRGDDRGDLPCTHRRKAAAAASRSRLNPGDRCAVQPVEETHPVLHR